MQNYCQETKVGKWLITTEAACDIPEGLTLFRDNEEGLVVEIMNKDLPIKIKIKCDDASSSSKRTSSSALPLWLQHVIVDGNNDNEKEKSDESPMNKKMKQEKTQSRPIFNTITPLPSDKMVVSDAVSLADRLLPITQVTPSAAVDEPIASSTLTERHGHIYFQNKLNNILYVHGGVNGTETLGDIVSYTINYDDNNARIIRPLSNNQSRSWHCAEYLECKNLIIVFGGECKRNDETIYYDDVQVFDMTIELWYPPSVSGKGPSSRSGHKSGILFDKYLVIYGGQKNDKFPHNIHVLDTQRWHWSSPKVDGKPPHARGYHTCTCVEKKMLLYYGGSDSTKCFNDVHLLVSNDKGQGWKWEQPGIVGYKPTERWNHSAVLIHNETCLLVHGGWTYHDSKPVPLYDYCILDLRTWSWYEIDPKYMEANMITINCKENTDASTSHSILSPSEYGQTNITALTQVFNDRKYVVYLRDLVAAKDSIKEVQMSKDTRVISEQIIVDYIVNVLKK